MVRIKGIFGDLDPITRFYKNQKLVLFVTFITYATFHATRKSYSVVKTRLRDPDPIGWAPFNNQEDGSGQMLLGLLDTTFLASYAISMLFFAGPLADRANLRLFVPVGLLGSCVGLMMWTMAYSYEIHHLGYFMFANFISGLFQSFGWPAILAILGTWIQGSNRGLIMGLWNVNTYLGNVIGSVIGGAVLESQNNLPWPYVFFYLSILGIFVALLFLWLVKSSPKELDFEISTDVNNQIIIETKQHREQVQNSMAELQPIDDIDDITITTTTTSTTTTTLSNNSSNNTNPRSSLSKNRNQHTRNDNNANLPVIDDVDDFDDIGQSSSSASISTNKQSRTGQTTRSSQNSTVFDYDDNFDNSNNGDDDDNYEQEGLREGGITFMQGLMIPGVLEFSLCLFFCKLISYTFLFWLPYYLSSNHYSDGVASYLSIYFDFGSILGSVLCGYLDRYRKPGTTSATLLMLSVPMLYIYYYLTSMEEELTMIFHISLLLLLGIIITGPYSLITTAVSIDLGEHPSLGSNKNAMATVSGIIDGFGSLGSINSGLLISIISKIGTDSTDGTSPQAENWHAVFITLIICGFLGSLFLLRIVHNETGHFGWALRLFGLFFWVLTCGGRCGCSRLCGCCFGPGSPNQDRTSSSSRKRHRTKTGSVNIALGELSTSYNKNRHHYDGDDLNSLGYVEDPSQHQHADSNDNVGVNYNRNNTKSPDQRYKKEQKMLQKEQKRSKRDQQRADRANFSASNDAGNGDDEQRIDVNQLYKLAQQ